MINLEHLDEDPRREKEKSLLPTPLKQFFPTLRHAFRNPIFIQFLGRLRWVSRLVPELKGRVLDIGCGDRPFDRWYTGSSRLVSVDFKQTSSSFKGVPPDVWADGRALPFEDQSFDNATCWEVIEHLPDPENLLQEARRILKPSGRLLLSVPLTWPLHGQPYDFYRWTPNGLRVLGQKNGFLVHGVYPTYGLIGVTGQYVVIALVAYIGRGNKVIEFLLRPLFGLIALLTILLDELFGRKFTSIAYFAILERSEPDSE